MSGRKLALPQRQVTAILKGCRGEGYAEVKIESVVVRLIPGVPPPADARLAAELDSPGSANATSPEADPEAAYEEWKRSHAG